MNIFIVNVEHEVMSMAIDPRCWAGNHDYSGTMNFSDLVYLDDPEEFGKGRLYAVMGGSGSGKTTLISIIAALARPSSGKVIYDGTDTAKINEDQYRAKYVSTIFQSYNLLYNYTAIENITMALHISGYVGNFAARADSLLHEVGIPEEKRKYTVQNLSGGEQQRIAIARGWWKIVVNGPVVTSVL